MSKYPDLIKPLKEREDIYMEASNHKFEQFKSLSQTIPNNILHVYTNITSDSNTTMLHTNRFKSINCNDYNKTLLIDKISGEKIPTRGLLENINDLNICQT